MVAGLGHRGAKPAGLWLLVSLALPACVSAPVDRVPDGHTDETDGPAVDTDLDKPRCGDVGSDCEALPLRPTTWTCGPAFTLDADQDVVWPETLSETGCFTSILPLVPTSDVVPFSVRAPLWSDGAHKQRWMSIPPDAHIEVTATGQWQFPAGAVLLKSFALWLDDADPASEQLLELRVMVRTPFGWSFATYVLDDDGLEGRLLVDRGSFRTFNVSTREGPIDVTWWYPNAAGCETCHRDLAEEALGPRTVQLNRNVDYGDVIANQIVALDAAGWLTGTPSTVEGLPRMVDPYNAAAPVDQRARAWLQGQCAHCHAPGGFVPPELFLDLRHDTPLAGMHACNEPRQGGFDLPADVLLSPGHADDSLIVQRIEVDGIDRMPAGITRLDVEGLAVVKAWIDGLSTCP